MSDQVWRMLMLRNGMSLDEAARQLSALHLAKEALTGEERNLLGIAEGLLELVRVGAEGYMDSEVIEADLHGTAAVDSSSHLAQRPRAQANPITDFRQSPPGDNLLDDADIQARIDELDLPAEFTASQTWWSEWDTDRAVAVDRFHYDPNIGNIEALVADIHERADAGHTIELRTYLPPRT